jgi:hypothetical protein
LRHVASEDRWYEVPDALGFRDYLRFPDLFAAFAAKRGATADLTDWRPQRYDWFPYPKWVGGYRQMTTPDAVDRVVYRLLAFNVAFLSDPSLSGHVFGNRLLRPGASSIRVPTKAWVEFKNYQLASLSANAWGYTCVSDLSGFYLAINTELFCNRLRERSIPEHLVQPLERLFNKWHSGKEFRGLPVGGESSGVLSNTFLLPVDELLSKYAGDHGMYGDDFAIFAPEVGAGRAILEILDETFSNHLGLKRNIAKTHEFTDPEEAADYIENHLLASIEVLEEIGDDETATHKLYALWDERVMPNPSPDAAEVHFVLARLGKRADTYAVAGLLQRSDLLQVDPKASIGYLTRTAVRDQEIAERLCLLLDMPPTVTSEAMQLHICRFLASASRTSAVAAVTERVLDDGHGFRGQTRAMAAQARSRCPNWHHADAIDRADADASFLVRRSLIGTTRGMNEHLPTRTLALRELARRDPALTPTAAWALAA